ncbi:MAG: phosphoglycolate phosphatase [Pseudomonadota bacterium]
MKPPLSASPWNGVLFDLDGTLLDTAPDFIVVLNNMLTDRGRAPLPAQDIRAVVSNGARALVALGFGGKPGEAEFDALNVELRDRYAQHLAVHTRLFPGLENLLRKLEAQGIPWGIVTNKPSIYTLPLLDALQLRTRCASIVCPDQVTHTKPHPEPMYKACAEMNVEPARCVYVGDHERDIAAGRNAGMQTVVAGWGYIGPDEHPRDWQPDFIVDSVRALDDLLFPHRH